VPGGRLGLLGAGDSRPIKEHEHGDEAPHLQYEHALPLLSDAHGRFFHAVEELHPPFPSTSEILRQRHWRWRPLGTLEGAHAVS